MEIMRLLLAGVLVTAGLVKLIRRAVVPMALGDVPGLGRFVRKHPRGVAVVVATTEVAAGLGAILLSGTALATAAVLMAVLYSAFAGVLILAKRQGLPCGCLGGTRGPAVSAQRVRVGVGVAVAAWLVGLAGRGVGPVSPLLAVVTLGTATLLASSAVRGPAQSHSSGSRPAATVSRRRILTTAGGAVATIALPATAARALGSMPTAGQSVAATAVVSDPDRVRRLAGQAPAWLRALRLAGVDPTRLNWASVFKIPAPQTRAGGEDLPIYLVPTADRTPRYFFLIQGPSVGDSVAGESTPNGALFMVAADEAAPFIPSHCDNCTQAGTITCMVCGIFGPLWGACCGGAGIFTLWCCLDGGKFIEDQTGDPNPGAVPGWLLTEVGDRVPPTETWVWTTVEDVEDLLP